MDECATICRFLKDFLVYTAIHIRKELPVEQGCNAGQLPAI
jgi:hypothetical protein